MATTVTVTISKAAVYEQVAMTTEYVGAKMAEDAGARERVMTTDGSAEQLDRFMAEADAVLCDQLKGVLSGVTKRTSVAIGGGAPTATVTYTFTPSSGYDETLTESLQDSVMSYYVNAVIAKWFGIANKPEAADYAARAAAMLEDAKRKLYWKKRPTRPVYA